MTSLFIHAALGALTVGVFFYVNAHLYRSDWRGSPMTFLEGLYYVLAVGVGLHRLVFQRSKIPSASTRSQWVSVRGRRRRGRASRAR
jgi:hypothetical protein